MRRKSKNKLTYIISLIIILLGVLSFIVISFGDNVSNFVTGFVSKEKGLEVNKYCEVNNDCVKAVKDCCGCSGGGQLIAINEDYKQDYLDKCSEDIKCPAVESNHWSCDSAVGSFCVDNMCVLESRLTVNKNG